MAYNYTWYPDPRYVYDTSDNERELTMFEKYQLVTGTNKYLFYRDNEAWKLPYSCAQYQHPEFYFWATKEKLCILGTSVELDMYDKWNDRKLVFAQNVLGNSWDKKTLQLVHGFLRMQKFTPYYKALLKFKWHTQLLAFPLFDQYEYIALIDGKLFGNYRIQVFVDGRQQVDPYCWLLTTKAVNDEIKRMGGVIPPKYKGIRAAVSTLVRQLVDLHQNDPYATTDIPDDHLSVIYREGILDFIPTLKSATFSDNNYNIPCPISLGSVTGDICCSQQLEDCLFRLTDGDFAKLDLLAELFARIVCSSVPSKYLWYIHGKPWSLGRVLSKLVDHKASDLLYRAKGEEWNTRMVYEQVLNFPIQYNRVPLSSNQFMRLNYSKIDRYINGGQVLEIDDPYQIVEDCTYYPTVIYLYDGNLNSPSEVFKKLPWREIYVPDDWTETELSEKDYQWLKTCFVARGLQIINSPESRSTGTEQVDLEQLVHQFVDTFCEEDPGSYVDGKTFYDAISKYIDTLPFTIQLSGSTKFLNSVEQWIGQKRTEIRSNNNRKGFEGIRLNMDKLKVALDENKSRRDRAQRERTERSFHNYLNEITSLVLWPT